MKAALQTAPGHLRRELTASSRWCQPQVAASGEGRGKKGVALTFSQHMLGSWQGPDGQQICKPSDVCGVIDHLRAATAPLLP